MLFNRFVKLAVIVILMLSFSCGGGREGIKIVYLFDISTSFIENRDNCLNTARKIFQKIIEPSEGLEFPQKHEMYLIDINPLNPNNSFETIEISRPSVFLRNQWSSQLESANKKFDENVKTIQKLSGSRGTNINGAILRASNALQGTSIYGKVIILFSDLENVTTIEIPPDIPNLEDITIYVIWEYNPVSAINPTSIVDDQDSIKEFLIDAGSNVDRIHFEHISSVDPKECIEFIRRSF